MRLGGLIGLLILVALAAYVTKPNVEAHQRAADAWFETAQREARADLDLGSIVGLGIANVAHGGTYIDEYVVSRYVITVGDAPFLDCFGIFTHVSCKQAPPPPPPAPSE